MEVKIKEEIKVTLILNKNEAKWLKGIIQNPLYGQTLDDEAEIDYNMRGRFWRALDSKGIKLNP